jgi:formylglycine-generating enzyme required for sulfatase activity
MRQHTWLLSGVGLLLIAALAAVVRLPGADPSDQERLEAEAAPLIEQLGDDAYDRREEASRALEEFGEPVLPLLRQVIQESSDPEIRTRAMLVERVIIFNARESKSIGLKTVLIDSGEFEMGAPEGEDGRRGDETPHRVKIARTFLLGSHEVTQWQYKRVMEADPSWFSTEGEGRAKVTAFATTSEFPVESVTWFDALEFCNRLSKLDGYEPYYALSSPVREKGSITSAAVAIKGGNGYRLPTEAEWEYACRAGSKTRFHFGNTSTGTQGNMKSIVAAGGYGGGGSRVVHLGRTAAVGSYPPNPWGLYDMHGNVGEWCWDWYDKEYYERSPDVDPQGPELGKHRVLRGGSWLVSDGSCRSASRMWLLPGERKEHWGFRVARSP